LSCAHSLGSVCKAPIRRSMYGQPGQQGYGMPYGGAPYGGMHPGAGEFVPGMYGGNGYQQPMNGGASPYLPPGQQPVPQHPPQQRVEQPPTDEEQAWLETQMEKDEQAKREAGDSEKLNAAAAASAAAPAADGGFDDVMKMIEENRRKNEAKRAAQSARNAEITAAFEARMKGGQ